MDRRFLPAALAVLALCCLLRFPDTVTETALESMSVCVRRIVPLLFPYTVLSSLVVRRGWPIPMSGTLAALFRLPPTAGPVLVSGLISGFPVGAEGAAELLRTGWISRMDAARLTAVSSAVSPAFLIGAVGGTWGCPSFGWFLFGLTIAALLVFSRLSARSVSNHAGGGKGEIPLRSAPPLPFSAEFGRSVSLAGNSCLAVTASVTFFRICAAAAGRLFPPGEPVFALFFEFSSAVSHGAALGGIEGAAFAGAAVGLGGLSVLSQIAARCAEPGIPLKLYLCSRLWLAFVLSAGAAGFAFLHPLDPAAPVFSIPACASGEIAAVLLLLASAAVLPLFFPHREYFVPGT